MGDGGAPKVGLALSGGGARGLAHIGVLKVLRQRGVPIDVLAGTSMGGLVAAAYAVGLTPEYMEREALRMGRPRRLLSLADPTIPRRGLFEGQKIAAYLDDQLGDCTFDDLRCCLNLIAVDLESGESVTLADGRVTDAVRATIALPGLFRPVERGDQVLVDGGLLDHLPAKAVRQAGADVVIAVDVATEDNTFSTMIPRLREYRYIPAGIASTFEVILRSLDVMMRDISRRNVAEAAPDVVIRPDIPPGVSVLTGFSQAGETIAAGERAALDACPDIEKLLIRSTR